MKLYACLGSGNCMKPWLVLKQLGLPFELQLLDVLAGAQRQPDYLAINPLGIVPYLETDDGCGIGESNAMLWYLADGTDLMPQTAQQRAEALQWMFFEQSKLEPFISPARFFSHILPHERENRAADIAAWQDAARPGLARLDAHLEGRRFVLGDSYSIADVAIFGYVHVLEEAGLNPDDTPHVMRWIDAVKGTEGFAPLEQLGAKAAQAA